MDSLRPGEDTIGNRYRAACINRSARLRFSFASTLRRETDTIGDNVHTDNLPAGIGRVAEAAVRNGNVSVQL